MISRRNLNKGIITSVGAVAATTLLGGVSKAAGMDYAAKVDASQAKAEAEAILKMAQKESSRKSYTLENAAKYPAGYHVWVPSVLAFDFTYGDATAKFPLYRGVQPNGDSAFYILTESSDKTTAKMLGIAHAPRLAFAADTEGVQKVSIDNGTLKFRGSINFGTGHKVVPGDAPNFFPPKEVRAGGVADAEWSGVCQLPSGQILNAQMVANSTGTLPRALDVNKQAYTATLSLLDGMQGGRQYFYHIVTEASDVVPAALENGVVSPRLAKLPSFGNSGPGSALLGFSPVLNGPADIHSPQHQGFISSLANNGIDPINVFPYGGDDMNYSPLWDAHVSQWTEKAKAENKVRRIVSFNDLRSLVDAGLVESAFFNPQGPGNPFVAGLRPSKLIINCPAIVHPEARFVRT